MPDKVKPRKEARGPALPAMALTRELIDLVARTEPDTGPLPSGVLQTDEDYHHMVEGLLAQHRPKDLWVFAYGSLIWKPEFEHTGHCRATAHGWHRAFCLRIKRWRGTPAFPGLMMALDRGGCCQGVAYRLPDADHSAQLHRLVRRETTMKPATNVARWIDVRGEDGERRKALAMTANPRGPAYTGKLALADVARILARAAGHWGTGAEYLFNTVHHLDQFGIRDRNLWRLQDMVAKEIMAWAEGHHGAHTRPE